jgi:hypothetical protein
MPDMRQKPSLRAVLIAGTLGQTAFEIYAWLFSPFLFGVTLEPSKLIVALFGLRLGIEVPYALGFALHAAVGIFGFTASVLTIYWFLQTRLMMAGLISGVILWFIAQGTLAPLVGRSFMMGLGPYTQSSFVGHVMMTLIIAYFLKKLSTLTEQSSNNEGFG